MNKLEEIQALGKEIYEWHLKYISDEDITFGDEIKNFLPKDLHVYVHHGGSHAEGSWSVDVGGDHRSVYDNQEGDVEIDNAGNVELTLNKNIDLAVNTALANLQNVATILRHHLNGRSPDSRIEKRKRLLEIERERERLRDDLGIYEEREDE